MSGWAGPVSLPPAVDPGPGIGRHPVTFWVRTFWTDGYAVADSLRSMCILLPARCSLVREIDPPPCLVSQRSASAARSPLSRVRGGNHAHASWISSDITASVRHE
jgi:hypothetical protein